MKSRVCPRCVSSPKSPSHALPSDALHHLAARGLSDSGGPKPLLLRVLTDLFVMRATHTSEETRQFAEIARRLLH